MSRPPSVVAGEEPRTRVLIRFTATERALHWSIALPTLVLLLSGLFLRFESLQALMVGYDRRVGLRLHLLAGLALLCGPPVVALLGDRRALAAAGRALLRMDREDRRFLRELPRWLGDHPEAGREVGRFNGGQKLNALVSGLVLLLASATGLSLWIFPPRPETAGPMQALVAGLALLHEITTYILLPVVVGHLYMALVHPRTRGSLRGILFGFVDADWARRHHPRWYKEVVDGASDGGGGKTKPPGEGISSRGLLSAPVEPGITSRSSPASSRPGGGPPAA